ncbi:MAG: ATP-binding protein [Candidatus Krumholzibacteriia bacterium]
MAAAVRNRAERDRLGHLLLWRVMLAIFLTGAGTLASVLAGGPVLDRGLVLTLLALYASLGVAWHLGRAGVPERPLLGAQLAVDTIAVGLLVHLSGGPHSAFPALHCLIIVLAASFLGPRAALMVAGLAAVLTGGGHAGLALGGWLSGTASGLAYTGGTELLVTFLHVGLFLVVGMVGGELASRSSQRRRLQEHAAHQVARTRTEVRSILDNLSSGLVTVDLSGRVTRINPAACRLLQVRADEVLGQLLQPALGPGGEALAAGILDVAAAGPPLRRAELPLQRGDRQVPLGVTVNYLEDGDGEICGAVAIFTDLTEVQRMREHLRKADRLAGVGELAASIAHEIRNPLGSIRGSVEILASELKLEGNQAQLLDLILKESARVNMIINHFLQFARLRPPSRRVVDCAEFLDEVALQVRQDVSAHGGAVELSCAVEPGDLAFPMDPELMVQLLLNLALNACEAMGYRGRLRIEVLGAAGESCEIRVSDGGPGIDADVAERIFDPFMTTKKDGTGLGLPMVARIAHAHGGTVEAENPPEGGALFVVRLPRPEEDPLAAPVATAGTEAGVRPRETAAV